MEFGLIKKGKKHEYWPKDFESLNTLDNKTRLGPMMNVQFQKSQIKGKGKGFGL